MAPAGRGGRAAVRRRRRAAPAPALDRFRLPAHLFCQRQLFAVFLGGQPPDRRGRRRVRRRPYLGPVAGRAAAARGAKRHPRARDRGAQFSGDSVNLEQALCYHRFSLEFLLAAALAGHAARATPSSTPASGQRIERAIVFFLAAMTDCAGRVPHIGDADDGMVFAFAGSGAASPYQAMAGGYGAQLVRLGRAARQARCARRRRRLCTATAGWRCRSAASSRSAAQRAAKRRIAMRLPARRLPDPRAPPAPARRTARHLRRRPAQA